ncbi:hypothetical protein AVE44_26290 [Salmonella enterica subsp. enterica serovar Typhimurium]|nr:hypothetical protein [Salmonella enterica subsp. enterica serovar Typhimurium]
MPPGSQLTRGSILRHALDQLAAAPVNDSGGTVGSVYEYAALTYKPAPRPGENPAAVTDEHLRHAIEHVQADA